MWFDSHCHLDFPELYSELESVLKRARGAGVSDILTIGTHARANATALEIAGRCPGVHAAIGIHPHDAADATEEAWAAFEALARDPRVVALGEMGLDYAKNYSPKEVQAAAFRRQLEIAARVGKPVILHCREAFEDCLALVREVLRPPVRGIAHCFSGDVAMAGRFLDLGFHLSFAGPLTYPKSDRLRATAAAVPLDRILVETDAPFLAPQAHRGRRNEPAFVVETGTELARLRGLDPREIAARTAANVRAVLGLP